MATAEKSTKRTAKPTALSREKIIKAAYQLAKKDPVNALSMRKIATRLKVTPMAIYKYFSDKDELTAAVIDMHMTKSDLIPDDIDQADWRSWIKSAFLRMWDAYDAAPSMVQYMTKAGSFGPAVLSWQNEALKVLISAGLTPKQALTAHAALAELATGSSILMPIRRQGVERTFPTIWKAMQEGKVPELSDLSEEGTTTIVDYPWLMMCGQAMLEDMQDSRKAFAEEIELILGSLALQISANKGNA
ncbi:MAG: TetR/AcrR family transcriptional regulator [Ketobacteraceae bacterium]|nr:TetR/AcrR family transcriptional regulator [Ketobacteraceae bacterium]